MAQNLKTEKELNKSLDSQLFKLNLKVSELKQMESSEVRKLVKDNY